MKNIFKVIVVGSLLSFIGTSCNDLEEYNPSMSSIDTEVTTPEGHTKIVNRAYVNLPSEIYGRSDGQQLLETGSDLWYMNNEAGAPSTAGWGRQMIAYCQMTEDQGTTKNVWQYCYEGIRFCNTAIINIDRAGYLSEPLRNSREGEARFLRAHYYLLLQEHYGGENGIFLILDEVDRPILEANRSSADAIYLQIIEDLKLAVDLLPITQADKGRIERKAALGMLARAYLSYGSQYKYHRNDDANAKIYFEKALETATFVTENQQALGCKLYDNFADIFTNSENCEEALYYMVNNSTYALNGSRGGRIYEEFRWFHTRYSTLRGMEASLAYDYDGNGRVRPTKYLLELFGQYDGRYDASFNEVWLCNKAGDVLDMNYLKTWGMDTIAHLNRPLQIGDTIMYATRKQISFDEAKSKPYICAPINVMFDNNGFVPSSSLIPGTYLTANPHRACAPSLTKFWDNTRATPITGESTKDIIVIRLAEMYLIAAECYFHLNNNEGEALKMINVLRDRAALSGHVADNKATMAEVASASNGGGYINFILDERARELCGERVRWNDLRRTKQLHLRLGEGTLNPNIIHFENPKHYLRAIPRSYFLNNILNPEEFGQNPGWIS